MKSVDETSFDYIYDGTRWDPLGVLVVGSDAALQMNSNELCWRVRDSCG